MRRVDYKRALTDFVYFAKHCLVDGKTGKPIKWTQAQLNQLKKLQHDRERTN
jgi:hypothetical protein